MFHVRGVNVAFEQDVITGGYSMTRAKTDAKGEIFLENLTPGAYKITEVEPVPSYVADSTPHVVNLEENRTTTLELVNVSGLPLKLSRPTL